FESGISDEFFDRTKRCSGRSQKIPNYIWQTRSNDGKSPGRDDPSRRYSPLPKKSAEKHRRTESEICPTAQQPFWRADRFCCTAFGIGILGSVSFFLLADPITRKSK